MGEDHDASPTHPQVTDASDWLDEAAEWWSQTLSEAGAGFRARLTEEAKHETSETPERVSARHFNLHVTPDLDAIIRSYACFIRMGMASYTEAYNGCLQYAWRRGAWGFNSAHLAELQDWLHQRLGDEIGPEG